MFEFGLFIITMSQLKTSYHFKITTSDAILEVFGTVMYRISEGVVLDLWCPEEPRLNQRTTTTNTDIPQVIETLLRESLNQMMSVENYSIRYLSY